MTTIPGNLKTADNFWTLPKTRSVLKKLINNRKRSWQMADFLIQSKLRKLETFSVQFEAARDWGLPGHIRLLYNYRFTVRDLAPGQDSRFQKLREQVLDLMDWIELQYETSNTTIKPTND